MKKLQPGLFCLILGVSFQAQGQIINVYEWVYSISKEKGLCEVAIDKDDAYFDFKNGVRRGIYDPARRLSRAEVRTQRDGFDQFYVAKKSQSRLLHNYSVLGFLACEFDHVSLRVYVYDHTVQQLKSEFIITTSDSVSFKDLSTEAAEYIVNKISSSDFDDDVSESSFGRFEELMRKYDSEELYNDYDAWKKRNDPDSIAGFSGSPQRISDVKDGFVRYLEREDYEFLDDVRKCINHKKGKCSRLERRYPKFYRIIRAVIGVESYRRANTPEKRRAYAPALRMTVDSLVYDDSPIGPNDAKVFAELKVNYDTLVRRFSGALQLALNCEKIISTNYDDPFEEASLFTTILTNEDISPILIATKRGGMDCGELKEYAFERLRDIRNEQHGRYRDTLSLAEQEYRSGNYGGALLLFQKANRYVGGVSSLCEMRMKQCEFSTPTENRQEYTLTGMSYILEQTFTAPSNNLISDDFDVQVSDGKVIVKIIQGESEVAALVKEVYYFNGEYHSRYKEDVEARIASGILKVYEDFSDEIEAISIVYYGSSDGAGFKRDNKLKIEEKWLRDQPGVIVKENTVYEKIYSLSRHEGKRVSWRPTEFKYNDLYNLKAKRHLYLPSGESPDWIDVPTDYAKNLLLAYLRARLRHENIMDLIGGDIDENLFKTTFFAEVNPSRGDIYRNVQMEISFIPKKKN